MIGPKKKIKSRSNKNYKRGAYCCSQCGWAGNTLAKLMKHKTKERHS